MDRVFPGADWARLAPEAAGFSAARLANARSWLYAFAGDQSFRLVIARHGYLVAEWTRGIDPGTKIRFHSASKSVYSSLLGIAVAEGRLPSIDARVVDYYWTPHSTFPSDAPAGGYSQAGRLAPHNGDAVGIVDHSHQLRPSGGWQ